MKTDVCLREVELYFLPVKTRVPLKFGPETLTSVTISRVRVKVETTEGAAADGWGETPLSVQWVWPSGEAYEPRHQALKEFCIRIAKSLNQFSESGHPMELGHSFQENHLKGLWQGYRKESGHELPWLAALVCFSAFDIAIHDAYGTVNELPIYETYGPEFMNRDLSTYLEPAADSTAAESTAAGSPVSFAGRYPQEYLVASRPDRLKAWHLVGGKDLIDQSELTGEEPDDGYPVLLPNWIERDGLKCLKVKLTGTDPDWDIQRLLAVGEISLESGVEWLTSDFNCTVSDPAYVNDILDRLMIEHPKIYAMILYVEQPFPYELEENKIDVHSVSARKPLFMDESAHDWRLVRLGRSLGWTGVALKTCKTQTGALLSLCWAKAHGMTLMVQDLTNPMLAQIPHVLLAAHAGTIMGVETNAMQFYPEASLAEALVHPGLYSRVSGEVDLSTLQGPGFGYRLSEISRELPEPAL